MSVEGTESSSHAGCSQQEVQKHGWKEGAPVAGTAIWGPLPFKLSNTTEVCLHFGERPLPSLTRKDEKEETD